MRALAAGGSMLLLAMQVILILAGSDRPAPYIPLQAIALIGSVVLVIGAFREEPPVLAAGMAIHAVARIAQITFGLSRLPILLNLALASGWIWASVMLSRRRSPRAALWFQGFAHVAGMLYVLGRFWAAIALALGAAGLFLAAPDLGQREEKKGTIGGHAPPERLHP